MARSTFFCQRLAAIAVHEAGRRSRRKFEGLITCRYHCWSYATNGDLKATPNIGGVDRHHREGFKNSDHGLKPVRSAVFMGHLVRQFER